MPCARPCVALPLLFCLLGLVLTATIILVTAPGAVTWALSRRGPAAGPASWCRGSAHARIRVARAVQTSSDGHEMGKQPIRARMRDGADEGFSHSIALWTFDRRGSRFEADVSSEAACLAGEVTAAIVGQSLDGDRQAIDRAEAMLDGSEHQITNVLAADAAGGGEETHGLAMTAVEREGDSHPFTVVAADLKAVGAPTPITFIHCNAVVMAPLVPANVAIEQQAVNLHDPLDALVIGRF
jgi:hypothetical protein